MAIQNSKAFVAKGQNIENLKARLPEAFEKLKKESKKFKPLTEDEKAFIRYALVSGYSRASITRSLNRKKGTIYDYISKTFPSPQKATND